MLKPNSRSLAASISFWRVPPLVLSLVLGLSLLLTGGWASGSPLDWESLQSDFLILDQTPPVDRSWFRMKAGESTFFSYDAGLDRQQPIPTECRWQRFQSSSSSVPARTEEYLNACEKEIRSGSLGWVTSIYQTMFLRIKISEQPFLKRVLLRLPNGYQQPGLLALKDTSVPRPLVILRAGIFGNSVDLQAERFLLMALFEQGPFNLLFLDSMTSPETMRWNLKYSAGVVDEGVQNYQIARQVQDAKEPLSRLVQGVHLAGGSMGGNGVLFAMILNEINPPVIQSALTLCPLVQFEKTFHMHRRNPRFFLALNFYSYFRLGVLRDRLEGLTITDFLHDSFREISRRYRGPVTDNGDVVLPKGDGYDPRDFYSGNDFLRLLPTVQKPVVVFATEKDALVPWDLNYQALEETVRGRPNFYLRSFPEGYHCSFPGSYDWDQFTLLLRDQILLRHPEISQRFDWRELPLGLPESEIPLDLEIRVRAGVGDDSIRVFLVHGSEVLTTLRLPIQKLDWATQGHIRTESEARALSRWVRANLEVVRGPRPTVRWPVLRVQSPKSAQRARK